MAIATVTDIVNGAKAAAAEFDAPIQTAMAVPVPSEALVQKIIEMGKKQTEILDAAQGDILASEALDAALAALKAATTKLNTTAQVMVNATAIVKKANELIGHGTSAVNAIKEVSG